MINKENVEKSKQRWNAYWNGELIDRCCTIITAPKKTVQGNYNAYNNPEDIFKHWTDIENAVKRKRCNLENTWFGGDAFPIAAVNFGAAGHAGFFKGSKFSFDRKTVWFDPTLSNIDDLTFDENSFLYKKTLELAQALADDSKGEYMVSMSDCAGNIDALSHLMGPDELMYAMIEDPDAVLDALKKIQYSYEMIHKETFDIVKSVNDGGSCIGWLKTWAPGYHSQLESDMSVMFSNDMFKQFVEPELRAQADLLDYSLYHLDGMEQIRHLDTLLAIERLHAIQWTQVVGQPPCTDFIPELQKIQKAGKSLYITIEPWQIETIMENLSSKGLCLQLYAASQEEGESMLKDIERLTHE